MIRSWRKSATRKFWERPAAEPISRIGCRAAVDLLLALNAAKSLRDLTRSAALSAKLKGDRKGQWAMTVNERWRICFEFRQGDAYNVELVDYHGG